MSRTFFAAIFTLLGCWSCSPPDSRPEIPIISLTETQSVDRIDSLFFEYIKAMSCANGIYYLSDIKQKWVVAVDESLQLAKTFGRSGKGPGEFIAPSQLAIERDILWILDADGQKMFRYGLSGQYLNSVPNGMLSPDRHFAIDSSGNAFLSDPLLSSGAPIVKLEAASQKKHSFGTVFPSPYPHVSVNERHLFLEESDQLIAVGVNIPIIETYSPAGELIHSTDLSSLPQLEGILQDNDTYFREKANSNSQVSAAWLNDAYFTNEHLFLLLWEIIPSPKKRKICEKVLVLRKGVDTFLPVAIFRLERGEGHKAYASICVSQDLTRMLTYDVWAGELVEFALPVLPSP